MIEKRKYSDYEKFTDEELIAWLREGEEGITEYICDKYKNLVRSKAKSMFILGGDNEDLIQEGMIGLFKAVRDYNASKDASFYTFADLCISRQMYTAVQASKRQKHFPLNTYISLYSNTIKYGEKEETDLLDALADKKETNPENLIIDKERIEYLESAIEKELSHFEKQVLDLYITGMGYMQIAKILGREEKATDNALQRIRTKIRKML